jgi:hypothetical protein
MVGETDANELRKFCDDAKTVYDLADRAFNDVNTDEERIDAVKIACTAVAVTDVANNPDSTKDEQKIRIHLGSQLEKLWTRVPKIRAEVAALLGSRKGASLKSHLDSEDKRKNRVRSAVTVLVQAEAFAAIKGLDPIAAEYLGDDKIPEAVAALVRIGLFGGTTVAQLEELRRTADPHAFSAKELYVVAGFLGEPYQKPDDAFLCLPPPPPDEVAILLKLCSEVTGLGKLSGWADLETHRDPSKCAGIKVNAEGQITVLDIYQKGLSGSLPSEVGLLTALESFNCSGNELKGTCVL